MLVPFGKGPLHGASRASRQKLNNTEGTFELLYGMTIGVGQ